MSEKPSVSKKNLSPDWLVRGVLTKVGDTFDRLTGRGWKPSSSLATSELVEKLKQLLDHEVRLSADGRKFVPHNITLKMQWDKFSTDAEKSMKALETEMLTAAVDHLNDKLYYTYAPLSLVVKPDYFTSGVKLFVSFEKFAEEQHEAELNVSVPGMKTSDLMKDVETPAALPSASATARFLLNGELKQIPLQFSEGRRVSVGRTKENALAIDDTSVSKMHGSLMLDAEGRLLVADTGSTNGTFVDGERISYGKAITIEPHQKLRFGTVDVAIELKLNPVEKPPAPELAKTEAFKVGEFEFTKKIELLTPIEPAAATEASIPIPPAEAVDPASNVRPAATQPAIEFDFEDERKPE